MVRAHRTYVCLCARECLPVPCGVSQFPSLKLERLLAILFDLGFESVRTKGSHRQLYCEATGRHITISAHDGHEISSLLVKKILMKDVGLSESDALDVATGRRKK